MTPRIGTIVTICALCAAAQAAPVERNSDQAQTIYRGAVAGDDWGRPLTSGDLDGDGYDDVVVAASESYGGVISRVYVMRGGPDAHRAGVVDLFGGGWDVEILGAAVDDNLGCSMATGDVNGDDIDDLLLVASGADIGASVDVGIAYLLYGGASFFDSTTRDLSNAANWDVRFYGPVAGGDMGGQNAFGGLDAHAAAIGNLNGDQYGDVILGVHLANGGATQSGRVYLHFGAPYPSGTTWNLAVGTGYDVRIDGKGQYDELGTFVLAGDLTGDGIDELIIPNNYASQGLFTSEGAVHIFRGRTTWLTFYNLASGPADITLLGAREYDELGGAAVGDFNGDHIVDIAAAAPGADAGAWTNQRGDGIIYGILGSSAFQTGTHLIDFATDAPDFKLIGEFEENLGDEISAGDFNADGIDDIAACERFAGPSTNGVVEVLYGRDFAAGETLTAAIDTDLRIVGAASDRIGFSLSASDVNNDGRDEVLFGTPFNNSNRGTVYLLTHILGDVDLDADVDLSDLAALLAAYGTCTGDPGFVAEADVNGDGCVDLADLAGLLANYGTGT